jgi:hypothetical protein
MTGIVDQYSDPSFGFLVRQVSRMPALEPFVKNASIESGETDALPDTAFAWPDQRKYPIHTAEQAALSYAYSKLAHALPEAVTTNIKNALEVYEVPLSVFEEVGVKEAALSDDAYLLPDLRLFPVTQAGEVKYAEQRVLSQLTKLDLPHRATVCANLVKKADHFKVELHPEVLKLAGFVVSSTKQVRDWLEARSTALPMSAHLYKAAYEKLAEDLKTQPAESSDRQGLLKLASTIAELDERAGLVKHYDRKLPDPLKTVFNTDKLAAEMVDLDGTMVPLSKLAGLPATFWEDLGGRELSDEICPGGKMDSAKLAMVVDTLPLDLKVILKSQLRA